MDDLRSSTNSNQSLIRSKELVSGKDPPTEDQGKRVRRVMLSQQDIVLMVYGNWFPARKLMYYAYEKCYALKMRYLLKNGIKINEVGAESNTVNCSLYFPYFFWRISVNN